MTIRSTCPRCARRDPSVAPLYRPANPRESQLRGFRSHPPNLGGRSILPSKLADTRSGMHVIAGRVSYFHDRAINLSFPQSCIDLLWDPAPAVSPWGRGGRTRTLRSGPRRGYYGVAATRLPCPSVVSRVPVCVPVLIYLFSARVPVSRYIVRACSDANMG